MIKIEIIYTFQNAPQEICELMVPSKATEEEFLTIVLIGLPLEKIDNLIKLSTCQYASEKKCIEWLLNHNGKIFFNTDVNKDEETHRWWSLKQKIRGEIAAHIFNAF